VLCLTAYPNIYTSVAVSDNYCLYNFLSPNPAISCDISFSCCTGGKVVEQVR
jgi:hypothetical protein